MPMLRPIATIAKATLLGELALGTDESIGMRDGLDRVLEDARIVEI